MTDKSLLEKSLIQPNLNETLNLLKQDILASLNCVKIGEIQDFDMTKKTVTVKVLFKRTLSDGSTISHPQLVDCPVFTLQGGGGFVQFPIAQGDHCLLLFSDRNIDAWYEQGIETVPYDQRCHDMSDAIALVGLNSLTSAQAAYLPTQVTLFYKAAQLVLKQTNVLLEDGSSDQLTMNAGAVVLKDQVSDQLSMNTGTVILKDQLTDSLTLMSGTVTLKNVSGAQLVLAPGSAVLTNGAGLSITIAGGTIVMTNGAGVAINMAPGAFDLTNGTGSQLSMTSGKIGIKNATTSLLTILTGLITTLEALTVQDGSSTLGLTTAAVSALEAYKAQVAVLLQ